MDDVKREMQSKLEMAGIPFERIQVFGRIKCNVHVICQSVDAATKWTTFLGGVFKGSKVACVPHSWSAAKNKGTSMLPTMRDGFLVTVAA